MPIASRRSSALDLIHALKASSDPPVSGGKTKIEIATEAWNDQDFYLPGKPELLQDFLLRQFANDKDNISPSNCLYDIRHWTLLLALIPPGRSQSSPLNTRLATTLSSFPLASILVTYFALLTNNVPNTPELITTSSKCILSLWAHAAPWLQMDSVLECFGGYLSFAARYDRHEPVARLGAAITSALHTAYSNLASKKKWYVTYVNKHLPGWLEYCRSQQERPATTNANTVYNTGIEILFNSDTLKTCLDQSDDFFAGALKDSLASAPSAITMLPRVFRSFIQRLKTYKNTLFQHGSARSSTSVGQRITREVMRFYTTCRSILDSLELDSINASTRVALLAVIEGENIYSPPLPDFEMTFKEDVEFSLKQLAEGIHEDIQGYLIECLCSLTRIDYDLISSSLQPIAARLLLVSTSKAFDLTNLLVECHMKTRSLDTYARILFEAINPRYLMTSGTRCQQVYCATSSSVLLHSTHLLRLGKGIHGFLSPAQTSELTHYVANRLQEAWQDYHKASSDMDTTSDPSHRMHVDEVPTWDIAAIAYSHTLRLASVVLTSLPVKSVSTLGQNQIQQTLHEIDARLTTTVLTKLLKPSSLEGNVIWSTHIVAAGALRIRHALYTHPRWGSSIHTSAKMSAKMSEAFKRKGLLPELQFELFRTLMSVGGDGFLLRQEALDRAIDIITKNIGYSSFWTGSTYLLCHDRQGNEQLALALLHLIVQRWLWHIDLPPFQPQLNRLTDVFVKAYPGTFPNQGLSASGIVRQTLRSSQLWELRTLRDAFLSTMSKYLSHGLDLRDTVIPQSVVVAYECLLFAPADYIPRSYRLELIKNAQTLDITLTSRPSDNSLSKSILVLRTFIVRNISQLGASDLEPLSSVTHLLDHHQLGSDPDVDAVTLELITSYFRLLLSTNQAHIPLSELLIRLSQVDLLQSSTPRESALSFVDVLTKDFLPAQLSELLQSDVHSLFLKWHALAAPHIKSFIGGDTSLFATRILSVWIRVLTLGRWLGVTSSNIIERLDCAILDPLGKSSSLAAETRSHCITIVIEELAYCHGSDRLKQLDTFLAAYITVCTQIEEGERLDDRLIRAFHAFAVEEFSHALSQLTSLVTMDDIAVEKRTSAMRLFGILLRDPPQGSLKVIQRFSTDCLKHFADTIARMPQNLQSHVLGFILRSCTERPATLRVGDLSNIWTVLSTLLDTSKTHEEATSHERFQEIVAIINSIIRLRRDLLVLGLPQLGHVLRRLLFCLRTIRPNLGATQTTLVMDSFPAWITSNDPLGTSAARALARLMENINAKTIARNTLTHQEKAESLVKPFSKHASYLLKAYVDVMNDPLCILPLPVRKELRPGLYVVCGMLSEHSRNALMVSAFDAGGKLTMKALWQEYEKQRYQGQG